MPVRERLQLLVDTAHPLSQVVVQIIDQSLFLLFQHVRSVSLFDQMAKAVQTHDSADSSAQLDGVEGFVDEIICARLNAY